MTSGVGQKTWRSVDHPTQTNSLGVTVTELLNEALQMTHTSDRDKRFEDESSFTYLRFDWISESQLLSNKAQQLADAFKQARQPKRKSKSDFVSAFNVVLTALEVLGAYEPDRWIRIVTDHEVYGGKTQRSTAHTRQVLSALEWLLDEGFMHQVDGKRVLKFEGSARTTDLPFAYVISAKWRTGIADNPMSLPTEISRNPLAAYVQLRTKVKAARGRYNRSISLPITLAHKEKHPDLIEQSEHLLKAADDVWRRVEISLKDTQLSPMQVSMTRIFNNGVFDDGGRFYCNLQNLKKTERKHLRFNGEPVIEIDFSGIHPHMLYHLQGDIFVGDPYLIEGLDLKREQIKIAFNTLLNRDSKKHQGSSAKSLANNLGIDLNIATELENSIYRLHHRVSGYFNTGYGLKLQRIDSDIAFEVMSSFILKRKQPILMIHDSAIVSVRHTELLKLCMVEAYQSGMRKHLMKNANFDDESTPLPSGLKVTSIEFTKALTDTIFKALEGDDVSDNEWTIAIKAS